MSNALILNDEDSRIYAILSKNPDTWYISPDGRKLYALVNGGMLSFIGPNFGKMSDAKIDSFIVDSLVKFGVEFLNREE